MKKLIKSNIGFIIALLLIVFVLTNTLTKAWVITQLMKVGFFQPTLKNNSDSKAPILLPDGIVFLDKNGKQVNLSAQKDKVLFINFWATWCPPCIAEMPSINQLHNRFKNNRNIVFLMVDVDNDFQKSIGFMDKHNYTLPVYNILSAVPSTILDGTVPTTLIVNKKGNIVFKEKGAVDYSNQEIINLLEDISKE